MTAHSPITPSYVRELADELRGNHGTKAEALATAWDRYCQHNNREQFNGEVRAIRGCVLIDFIQYRETY